jgi:tetratricopeptide (TPR) repeat protein
MTSTRHHADTESRASGLEGRIQDGLEWIGEHRRHFLIALVALVAALVLAAIYWEVSRSRRAEASAELAAIEASFVADMGAEPAAALVAEPANPEQATRAREAAIAELEAFAQAHGSSDLAHNASLRAAELEVDLKRLDAADTRLAALIQDLAGSDPRRAIALRLRGYVLEELGRAQEAAALYEAGAAVESYPARALLWLAAARTRMRLGANQDALHAFDQAIAIEPELATDPTVARERRSLEALIAQAPPAAAAAGSGAAPQ